MSITRCRNPKATGILSSARLLICTSHPCRGYRHTSPREVSTAGAWVDQVDKPLYLTLELTPLWIVAAEPRSPGNPSEQLMEPPVDTSRPLLHRSMVPPSTQTQRLTGPVEVQSEPHRNSRPRTRSLCSEPCVSSNFATPTESRVQMLWGWHRPRPTSEWTFHVLIIPSPPLMIHNWISTWILPSLPRRLDRATRNAPPIIVRVLTSPFSTHARDTLSCNATLLRIPGFLLSHFSP